MKNLVSLTLFLLSSFILFSNENKCFYTVYKISEDILIDGHLEENTWKKIPQETGFKYLRNIEKYSEKQTFFQIGWNEDNIFIGVFCEEPDIEKIRPKGKDGDPLWNEDSIEIFLSPLFPGYYQFIINPLGSKTQGKGKKINIETSSFVGLDFWSIEVKIPFSEIGKKPTKNEVWRFNIGRNITIGDDKYSTWANLSAGHFHDYENFGYIKFSEEELTEKKAKELSEKNKANFIKPLILKIDNKLKESKKEIEHINNDELLNKYLQLEEISKRENIEKFTYRNIKKIYIDLKMLLEEIFFYKYKLLAE